MKAPGGDEYEAPEDDACYGADGIRRIESPELAPDRGGRRGSRRERTGKRRTNRDRDEQERPYAEQELEQRDPARSVRPAEPDKQEIRQTVEGQEDGGRRDSDGGLDRRECGRGRRAPS